jgi:hypothetical protein
MKNKHLIGRLVAISLGLAFAVSAQAAGVKPAGDGVGIYVPDGKGGAHYENLPALVVPAEGDISGASDALIGRAIPQYGIQYHSGAVMGIGTGSPVNVYYIYYGNWTGLNPGAPAILDKLATNIGGTPYFNINTTYTDGAGNKVLNKVVYKAKTTDNYSLGTTLTDSGVYTVVKNAINAGKLPADANGVYFVLTTKDVNESSGFCTQYCGWHSYGTIAARTIKYSFVGDASRCPSACSAQSKGPNGNVGADAMASVIAHELEETVTDPTFNGWWRSSDGYENADICAWTFGTTSTAANGAAYNMLIGGSPYLIQQNWVNVSPSGKCAKSY